MANEHVAIWHLDCGKRLGIKRRIRRQQAVEAKNIGRHCINVVVAERLRRVLRHGAADVIEQRRRVLPIASDGTHRFWRSERALPADEPAADAALALCPVTSAALLTEYFAPAIANLWTPAGVTPQCPGTRRAVTAPVSPGSWCRPSCQVLPSSTDASTRLSFPGPLQAMPLVWWNPAADSRWPPDGRVMMDLSS